MSKDLPALSPSHSGYNRSPTGEAEIKGSKAQKKTMILVADDESDLLEIYSKSLGENGFAVSTATTGNEAVAKFIDSRPDVIILDYRMPKGDGLETASKILAMKPSARIIMLTADGAVLKEAERIGIELFLEKPISLRKLINSVRTVTNLKSASAIISR